MAFEGAMKTMGSAKPKMSKMGGAMKGESKPMPKGETEGEKGDSETTITHNSDGSHTMDGETHPSHLHVMAALGHKLTGDKHHIAHHDGMQIHTHGIHESGEHEEGGSHNSAEEAGDAMKTFMDEEAQEPAHQHEAKPMMGGYGG